jgi:hypothetical protein
MKKKISSIVGEMSGRTKIALVVCLLAVSVIAAGVIFNWDRLSSGSSAKAEYSNLNNYPAPYNDLNPPPDAAAKSLGITEAELDALNHQGGGPTSMSFQQKVLFIYRMKESMRKNYPANIFNYMYPGEAASHSYNFKTGLYTCPELTGDVYNTEWVMDSNGCAVKKGTTSNTTIPTTPEPTACQQCDSNIVCSCNCS